MEPVGLSTARRRWAVLLAVAVALAGCTGGSSRSHTSSVSAYIGQDDAKVRHLPGVPDRATPDETPGPPGLVVLAPADRQIRGWALPIDDDLVPAGSWRAPAPDQVWRSPAPLDDPDPLGGSLVGLATWRGRVLAIDRDTLGVLVLDDHLRTVALMPLAEPDRSLARPPAGGKVTVEAIALDVADDSAYVGLGLPGAFGVARVDLVTGEHVTRVFPREALPATRFCRAGERVLLQPGQQLVSLDARTLEMVTQKASQVGFLSCGPGGEFVLGSYPVPEVSWLDADFNEVARSTWRGDGAQGAAVGPDGTVYLSDTAGLLVACRRGEPTCVTTPVGPDPRDVVAWEGHVAVALYGKAALAVFRTGGERPVLAGWLPTGAYPTSPVVASLAPSSPR